MEINVGKNNGNSAGGVGFVVLLQLLFIGLKLGKIIKWSWWWVLAPTWISAGIVIFIIAIVFIVFSVRNKRKHW